MRNMLLALFVLIALPALAQTTAKPERKQETIELGNNRFLIFVGEPGATGFAYTADMVVTNNGVPHFEPLFMEEYDADTNQAHLSEGVAFQAGSYHFDKNAGMLEYTAFDAEKNARYQCKYHFAVDMFTLQEVAMQKDDGLAGIPKIIYKAKP